MAKSFNVSEIQRLVASDEMRKAIDKMLIYAEGRKVDWRTEATILSMDLCSLQKGVILGYVTWTKQQRIKRMIAYRIMELLDSIIFECEVPFEVSLNPQEKKILKRA